MPPRSLTPPPPPSPPCNSNAPGYRSGWNWFGDGFSPYARASRSGSRFGPVTPFEKMTYKKIAPFVGGVPWPRTGGFRASLPPPCGLYKQPGPPPPSTSERSPPSTLLRVPHRGGGRTGYHGEGGPLALARYGTLGGGAVTSPPCVKVVTSGSAAPEMHQRVETGAYIGGFSSRIFRTGR